MTSSTTPPRTGTGHHSSSSDTQRSSNTLGSSEEHKPLRLRPPRSLPPWIDSYEEKYGPAGEDQFRLLHPPTKSHQPQHNSTPSDTQRRVSKDGFVWNDPLQEDAKGKRAKIPHFLRYGRASMRGRKWDHLRSAEPVIVPGYIPSIAQPTVTWHDFVHSSAWGHLPNEESQVIDVEAMNRLQPSFNRPVFSPYNPLDTRASRRRKTLALYQRVWNMAIEHSLAPLIFRLIVMITSILALGIAAKIHEIEDIDSGDSAEETQSIVAIVVDCVAIPYIGYMIWDEYTGKPLGLRSVTSKISLILLDLFFIIFKSASTALAFESLVYHNLRDHRVRNLSKALASFMLIGLISWTMNFAVNIFRTVERLHGKEDDGAHGKV